jgi:hypothetical protein
VLLRRTIAVCRVSHTSGRLFQLDLVIILLDDSVTLGQVQASGFVRLKSHTGGKAMNIEEVDGFFSALIAVRKS